MALSTLVLTLVAAVALASCISAGDATEKPKNILFLAVDDLRPELSCYGSDGVPGTSEPAIHSPNFDRLASKSLLLLKNYVQQAVCSPTRTSLLTSRRPDRTRVFDLYSYFRTVAANYTTIPEYFLHQGFYTQGMGKIFHPGHASGKDDSCCSWTNASEYFHAPNLGYWSGTAKGGRAFESGFSHVAVPADVEKQHPLPDTQIADHAIATLKNMDSLKNDDQPFFLAVGFHKPHLPFVFPERMLQYYPSSSVKLPSDQMPPKDMPPIAWSAYGEIRQYVDIAKLNASGAPGTVLPKDTVLSLRQAYYAAVSHTDENLGRVLDALEASPYANNTVISIWGDHGWQLGEHGEWCKHTNFEFATHAPMMVHVPGLTDKGIKTEMYTEHADLFPTLVEASLGKTLEKCPPGDKSFKVATCTEGTSMLPLAKDPTTPIKSASFSQYPRGYVHPGDEDRMAEDLFNNLDTPSTSPCIEPNKRCTMGYSIITRVDGTEYRYTEWVDFNTIHKFKPDFNRVVGRELYNHATDPGENFNIYKSEPELCSRLSDELRVGAI